MSEAITPEYASALRAANAAYEALAATLELTREKYEELLAFVEANAKANAMTEAVRIVTEHCHCDAAYKDRGLTSPDCAVHDIAADLTDCITRYRRHPCPCPVSGPDGGTGGADMTDDYDDLNPLASRIDALIRGERKGLNRADVLELALWWREQGETISELEDSAIMLTAIEAKENTDD